jgi:ATP-dependent Clp protease ATP-binding subunit ClpB
MNLNNFTIKASEVLQQAQQLAFNAQNPTIETEHLMKALLDQEDSPVEYLLKKNNVTVSVLETKLDELLGKLPKTSGTDPAQALSRDANNVVLRAGSVLKQFGDEFITPEHLVLELIEGNDVTAKLLKNAGLTEKGLISAVKELRKVKQFLPTHRRRNSTLTICQEPSEWHAQRNWIPYWQG